MVGTFVRTLCLFTLALIIGWVHNARRTHPISFKDVPPPVSTGEGTGGDPGDNDPAATDPAGVDPPGSDPAAGGPGTPADAPAFDPVLDAEVLPGQITLREAVLLYEFGATFLDARNEDEYEAARIAGSYWMSASRVGTGASFEVIELLDPAEPIVIYCTGGDCDASENTRRRLMMLGIPFVDIRIMGAGYEDWAGAGLPIEGFAVEGGQSGALPPDASSATIDGDAGG